MEFLDRIGLTEVIRALTWLDLSIIIVVGLMTIWGLWSGLVWQIYRIVSLVLGVSLASRFGKPMSDQIGPERIANDIARQFLCYLLVFFGVVVGCYLVGRLVKKLIDRIKFGPVDRVLGALFGFLKGVLVCGAIIIGILSAGTPEWLMVKEINKSRVSISIVHLCENLWGILPVEFREKLGEQLQRAKENVQEEEEKAEEKATETLIEKSLEKGKEVLDKATGKKGEPIKEKQPPKSERKSESKPRTSDALAPTKDGVE